MDRIVKSLFFIALIFVSNARISAQVFVLGDSCNSHFLQFEPNAQKAGCLIVKEMFNGKLLFRGNYRGKPDFEHIVMFYENNYLPANTVSILQKSKSEDTGFIDSNLFYNYTGSLRRIELFTNQGTIIEVFHNGKIYSRYFLLKNAILREEFFKPEMNLAYVRIENKSTPTLNIRKDIIQTDYIESAHIEYTTGEILDFVQDGYWELNGYGYLYCPQKSRYYNLENHGNGNLDTSCSLIVLKSGNWLETCGSNGTITITEYTPKKTKQFYSRVETHTRMHKKRFELQKKMLRETTYSMGNDSVVVKEYNDKNDLIKYQVKKRAKPVFYWEQPLSTSLHKTNRYIVEEYQTLHGHGVVYWGQKTVNCYDTSTINGSQYVSVYLKNSKTIQRKVFKNGKFYRISMVSNNENRILKDKNIESYIHDENRLAYFLGVADDLYRAFDYDSMNINKDTWLVTVAVYNGKKYIGDRTTLYSQTGKKSRLDIFKSDLPMLHLAKDQLNCAYGLKNFEQKWIVPAVYEEIEEIKSFSGVIFYLAKKPHHFTIYNDSGSIVVKETYFEEMNLIQPHVKNYLRLQDKFPTNILYTTLDSIFLIDITGERKMGIVGDLTIGIEFENEVLFYEKDGKLGLISPPEIKVRPVFLFIKSLIITDRRYFVGEKYRSDTDTANIVYTLMNASGYILIDDINNYSNLGVNYGFWYEKNNQLYRFISESNTVIYNTELNEVNDKWVSQGFMGIYKDNKYGLCLLDGRTLLEPEYDSIQIEFLIIAYKHDSTFLFSRSGEKKFSGKRFEFIEFEFGGFGWFSRLVKLIRKDGEYGLLDISGNLLLDANYNKIYINDYMKSFYGDYVNTGSKFIFAICDTGMVYYQYLEGKIHLARCPDFIYFGKDLVTLEDAIFLKTQKLANTKEQYTHNGRNQSILPCFYTYTVLDSVNNFIGKVDALGDWQVKLDSFRSVRPVNEFYLVQLGNRKCGVVNCNGNYLVPPQFKHFAYKNLNGGLWYSQRNTILEEDSGYTPHWKLFTAKHRSDLDSVDYPAVFENKLAIFSQFGKRGIMNDTGRILVPAQYDRISMASAGVYILGKGDINFAWFQSKAELIHLPCKRLYKSHNGMLYFGTNKNRLYLLDNQFKILDSSDNYFCSRPAVLAQYFLKYFWDYEYVKYEFMDKKKQVLSNSTYNLNENLGRIYSHLNKTNIASDDNQYAYFNVFPEVGGHRYPGITATEKFQPLQKLEKSASDLVSPDAFIDKLNEGVFSVHPANTHVLMHHIQLQNKTEYFYYDSVGIYEMHFNNMFLADSLTLILNNITRQWQSIDNPDLACISWDKLESYCSNNWELDTTYFYIKVGHKSVAKFTWIELQPYLTQVWRKRLVPSAGH